MNLCEKFIIVSSFQESLEKLKKFDTTRNVLNHIHFSLDYLLKKKKMKNIVLF